MFTPHPAQATKPRQFSLSNFLSPKANPKELFGTDVWVADDEKCFESASIAEVEDDGTLIAKTASGRSVAGKKFAARDPRDEKESDLVQMMNVDTPNILQTLSARHAAGSVYTAVGQVGILISINPYRWLDIYSPALMREHYESFGTKELEPHVFALASDAYKALCIDRTSQCLVTSGESGSGKPLSSRRSPLAALPSPLFPRPFPRLLARALNLTFTLTSTLAPTLTPTTLSTSPR